RESRVVGWQGGSCEQHPLVVRCVIHPIERRGEMRARWHFCLRGCSRFANGAHACAAGCAMRLIDTI
ncbi:hypothetical protein, partial [Burkholderia sp. B10]|uniref:hypothetical protein n=1 Tax=Burkholderia sp. B10 TaxID=1178627 RepID=UPI001AB06074